MRETKGGDIIGEAVRCQLVGSECHRPLAAQALKEQSVPLPVVVLKALGGEVADASVKTVQRRQPPAFALASSGRGFGIDHAESHRRNEILIRQFVDLVLGHPLTPGTGTREDGLGEEGQEANRDQQVAQTPGGGAIPPPVWSRWQR